MEKFKLAESIRGERIVLLKRAHDHDEAMWQAIEESRQFIREYLFWVDTTNSYQDVVKTTDIFAEKWEKDNEWGYDIYSVPEHQFLGCIGVHLIDFKNCSAEIGYWLRVSEQHKGYMAEAVKIVEEKMFENGIHRLVIKCDTNNRNSANVAIRAGYHLESIAKEALYHYTGLHDEKIYVKLSPYPAKDFA